MALTVDKLINDDRFCGENVLHFLLYLPIGILLMLLRILQGLVLWIASIILPNKSAVRQVLSTLACWTFGVYVRTKGTRDPRCSVLVGNYVSCLDSLAASHVLGTISLRKWKVPPFFASTLGIRNAAQFVRKQHFSECREAPLLLQPEGGATNGRGLLRFTDWPFPLGARVQPVTIKAERLFTKVTVHREGDARDKFPWSDALWFLWTPVTVYEVTLLPALERHDDDDATFYRRIRETIALALDVELSDLKWEELNTRRPRAPRAAPGPSAGGSGSPGGSGDATGAARRVKEVLPMVPLRDIMKDLALTRSVDVTITNFLEGRVPYEPEPAPATEPPATTTQPRYVTPAPTGVFPKSAKERQLGFQERKARMVADARRRYVEKHSLEQTTNC